MRTGPACIGEGKGIRGTQGGSVVQRALCLGCTLLALFLSSCGAAVPLQRSSMQGQADDAGVRFSIVGIVHGDGNYLYHDTSGNDHLADEEALAGMKAVAERNPYAEVFIFHQKRGRTAWLFFPLSDGEFFYYRGGRLVAHETYWRDQARSHLAPEADLYHRFHAGKGSRETSFFLYYGHEIPESGGTGYDASYPERPFTVRDLAEGLESFTGGTDRYELMILSTCYGGTPYTIRALGPSARTIVASPDNLHLSYFTLHTLERLDSALTGGDIPALAKQFARRAFDRLTAEVQTAVSVAVYEVDRVQEYITAVGGMYDAALSMATREQRVRGVTVEHCDCADAPGYAFPAMTKGVDILYRPPAFGRSRLKESHSGWECWREILPPVEVVRDRATVVNQEDRLRMRRTRNESGPDEGKAGWQYNP